MAKKPDPIADLSAKLLQALGQQRVLGPASYPLTLARLGELADAAAPPELVLQASKKKPFHGKVLLVQPKDVNTPLALLGDLEQLARSHLLLEYVVSSVCTPAAPTIDPAKLKTKVPAKLKPAFAAAVTRAVQENALPASIGIVTVKNKPHLHWKQWPLPRDPVEVLAEGLVRALQARKQAGAYPATVRQLADGISAAQLKQAVAHPIFAAAVVLGTKDIEGPAALADDRAALAGSALLLTTAFTRSKPGSAQALSAAELKKQVAPALVPSFVAAVTARLEAGELPAGFGRVWRHSAGKKDWLLFALADAGSVPPALAEVAAPPPVDFAAQFEEQFTQLNRAAGGHNLISLVELRRAVPVDRATFDAELLQLRRAGLFVLKLAEGRHGVSPAEQEAGIVEDGRLLLYVARKLS